MDGIHLDVDVTLPPSSTGNGPFLTIVILAPASHPLPAPGMRRLVPTQGVACRSLLRRRHSRCA